MGQAIWNLLRKKHNMSNVAIIPARGGSKRLPRKNILPFMGKPMLLWTCEAARDSECFDAIVVSTDDDEIAGIVRAAGFSVDERPAELGSDTASCADVCLEYLARAEQQGTSYDILCCLYATAPLRRAEDIRGVMALMTDETDAVHAVCGYNHPPHQMLYANADGYLVPAFPLLVTKKSQQVPTGLIGNGSTYAISVTVFRKYKSFYPPRIKGYQMSALRSVDIDTAEDVVFLEMCAQRLEHEEGHHGFPRC